MLNVLLIVTINNAPSVDSLHSTHRGVVSMTLLHPGQYFVSAVKVAPRTCGMFEHYMTTP